MLLNDIGKSPDATFRRINQHLETNYGFKISEDVSDKDLVAIMEQIEEEITGLKVKGDDARDSSEISKRLLVLEGIRNLREHGIFHMGIPERSPDEESVIGAMIDRVVKEFKLSGNFTDSIKDAMNRYRSSEYRFLPDDEVEQRVYAGALSKLRADPVLSDAGSAMMESDKWGTVGKRASAHGGHAASEPSTQAGQQAAKVLDNPDLELVPRDEDEKDPWKAQAKKRAQGIVHTEGKKMREHKNLVKNLRRLLETEVSQAEVMMAAKGFAQELQEMVEKIGRLQNEDLPPVTDQMRETYGMESASAFQTQIYGALQGVMDSLYTAKQQVDDAVGNMASTGQVTAQTDMDVPMDGMDDGMGGDEMAADDGMGDENDLDNIGAELGAEGEANDEFGGEEALGRSKKMESILQKKVMEMFRLVAKARALRESQIDEVSDATVGSLINQRRGAARTAQDAASTTHVQGSRKTSGQMQKDSDAEGVAVSKRNNAMDLAGKRLNRTR